MQALLRPRHLAVTARVFLALGGAGVGIVGVDTADDAEFSIVDDFHVPLPRQGDMGHYAIHESASYFAKMENASRFQETGLDFHWGNDRMLPNQEDELVLSNRLQ